MAISPIRGYEQTYNPYGSSAPDRVSAPDKSDSLKPKSERCET